MHWHCVQGECSPRELSLVLCQCYQLSVSAFGASAVAWEKIWLSPPLSLSPLVLNLKGIRSTPGLHWQLGTCSPPCVSKDTSEVTTFVEGAQVLLLGWVDTSPCFFQRLAWWSFTPASIYWSALGGGGPISLGQWRMCCGHAEWAWRMFWHKLL